VMEQFIVPNEQTVLEAIYRTVGRNGN
jgi:hypothetical protein